MNKITNTQRLAALSIIALTLLIVMILVIHEDKLIEIAYNVTLSIGASALYFCLHSAITKNKECEEIALLAIAKLNPAYPVNFYGSTSKEDPRFSKDIEKDLNGNDTENLYYEGVTIKTFSRCLVNSFSSHNWNRYPNCYFIISKASLLNYQDCKDLLKSIMRLRELCLKKTALKFEFCILDYNVPFHIHLTDKRVWFSPFKGNNVYPTTFLYEKNDSADSYYRNLKNMMLRTLDTNKGNTLTLCGCNNHNIDDKAQLIKIFQKLEVLQFITKNRSYYVNNRILSSDDIKTIKEDSIISIIEKIIR